MPEEEVVKEEKKATSGAKPKKALPPMAMLGVVVVVQLVAAWAVAQFMILPRLGGGEPAATETVAEGERGEIYLMDDLVVTLVAEDGTRFLKISPGLECESSAVQSHWAFSTSRERREASHRRHQE